LTARNDRASHDVIMNDVDDIQARWSMLVPWEYTHHRGRDLVATTISSVLVRKKTLVDFMSSK
jgi:hypothetical protein